MLFTPQSPRRTPKNPFDLFEPNGFPDPRKDINFALMLFSMLGEMLESKDIDPDNPPEPQLTPQEIYTQEEILKHYKRLLKAPPSDQQDATMRSSLSRSSNFILEAIDYKIDVNFLKDYKPI